MNIQALIAQAERDCAPVFAALEENEIKNTRRVLAALQAENIGLRHFAPTTGYGYDDVGRDALERVFARLFGAESAIVRPSIACGTAALSLCLFGLLLLCWKKKKFHGEVILLYFTGYGIGRAWIEMIRTDQLYLPGTQFPVCFLVSIAAILVSAVTEFVIRRGLKEGRYQDLLWDPAGVSAIGVAGSAEDAAGTAAEDTSETPAEASGSAQEQN